MKAKLQFNLPDDEHEFQMAIQGASMHSVLWEMDQWLRAQYKYMSDAEYSEDAYKAYETARSKLNEFMNDENISFD
jgi:hypothetical protein